MPQFEVIFSGMSYFDIHSVRGLAQELEEASGMGKASGHLVDLSFFVKRHR